MIEKHFDILLSPQEKHVFTGSEIKLVKKLCWAVSSPALADYLKQNPETSSSWHQLNPPTSRLSLAAVSFLVEFILTTIQRPGMFASADSWVTLGAMPTLDLDFLKDKCLLLAGAGEQLGAAMLQLLQPAPLKQLVIVPEGELKTRRELNGMPSQKCFDSDPGPDPILKLIRNRIRYLLLSFREKMFVT